LTQDAYTDLFKLIPADIKFDPNATPPQYTNNEDSVIEVGTHVRVKLIGTRAEVGGMYAIASIKEDYLGYVACDHYAHWIFVLIYTFQMFTGTMRGYRQAFHGVHNQNVYQGVKFSSSGIVLGFLQYFVQAWAVSSGGMLFSPLCR
jgi:hypothetical protein